MLGCDGFAFGMYGRRALYKSLRKDCQSTPDCGLIMD